MSPDEIARLRALCAAEIDCVDNSCRFVRERGGMRTNGGCRCVRDAQKPGTISKLSAVWRALPAALDEIERLRGQVLEYAETLASTRREREDKLTRVQELICENAILRGLLTRVVKYVTEDRAVTPRKTRLARVVEEIRSTLGLDQHAGRK